jgi:hypothetical protein
MGVINPECMAQGHAMDQFDLPDDATTSIRSTTW